MTYSLSHVENKTMFYCFGVQTINIYALPTVTQTLRYVIRFPESFIFKSARCSELSISVNAKNNFLCKFYVLLYSICQMRIKTTIITVTTTPELPATTA